MSIIAQRVQEVKQNIVKAAKRANRDPGRVHLIVVTKTRSIPEIRSAVEAGITEIGENRVQEFKKKVESLADLNVSRHLIGHLQTNKVKTALQCFDWIHSVDSLNLAREIQKRSEKLNQVVNILIQVNTSGEASKFGVEPERAVSLVEQVKVLPNLQIKGLMTIAAFLDDPEQVRPMFRELSLLREHVAQLDLERVEMEHLSMGMTNDYEVAIEEGATMVRIGTAIFGARNYN